MSPWVNHPLKRSVDVFLSGALLLDESDTAASGGCGASCYGPSGAVSSGASGLGGTGFVLSKFRTMSDEFDAHGCEVPEESRITALGRLLRSTSCDELPQLWQVLRGDMTWWVRVPCFQIVALYTDEQARRLKVRPGITARQVSGRNSLTWEEKFGLMSHTWSVLRQRRTCRS